MTTPTPAVMSRALALYRLENPRSRAVAETTWYGSTGTVRRCYCVFCRRLKARSSAKWPETVTARAMRLAPCPCPEREEYIERASCMGPSR
jgi:hypothetical protein